MNICILLPEDLISDTLAQLTGRRAEHIINIIKAQVHDRLKVGHLNGLTGHALVRRITNNTVELELPTPLKNEPPAQIPLTLILALPRPKMLQRSLQTIATMGVTRLCLIHTQRVEKSFWQTPLLAQNKVLGHLILGLEQGGATQLPELALYKNFKRFISDELDPMSKSRNGDEPLKFIAHPGPYPAAVTCEGRPSILAIGPEGGFVDKEVSAFLDHGFSPIQLGQRILRVETAIPVTIAKLY